MIHWILIFWLFNSQGQNISNLDRATILYFNDAHEISPVQDHLGSRGGVARIKTIVDKVRMQDAQTIVVFGGDLAGGTLFGAVYKGFPMVEAFNLLPLDIANFGQHDFDFGPAETKKLIGASSFTWISSNIIDKDSNPFANVSTYTVRESNRIKIGFIGLTDAMNTTKPTGEIVQLPLIPSVKKAIDLMKNEITDVDVVVAVTQTTQENNEQLLINEERIDIILSEEQFEERSNIYYVAGRPIISPCGNMGSVIQIDIAKKESELSIFSTVHPVDNSVAEEPKMLRLQKKYQDSLEAKLARPIAHVKTPLDGGVNTDFKCRWGETNLGNLITDAYRLYYKAEFGIINGGGIRANIPAGKLTLKNAYSVLPFHNRVCLIRISGQLLRQMLEHGVADVESRDGAFLQISGGVYRYNPKKSPGERIISVKVGDDNLEDDKKYTIALPDYILRGGNDFTMLSEAEILIPPQEGAEDVEILIQYCRELKTINTQLQNRIIIDREL